METERGVYASILPPVQWDREKGEGEGVLLVDEVHMLSVHKPKMGEIPHSISSGSLFFH